ncbi:60Kd inner membrane protein-domain-containing protein [Hypoxylon sp. FL1284]|nr:60Kd inner membrane protein-domain-containing protein [Hypoxylon sp. FL1284]
MLPSRGLSRSNPASALRTWSVRSQPARSSQVPLRHFSQAPSRSALSRSTLNSPSRPISIISSRTAVAATVSSGVFAQRSGASRNLSLWPFSSEPKAPEESQSAEASAPPADIEGPPASSYTDTAPASSLPDVASAGPSEPARASAAQYSHDSFSDADLESLLDIPEQIGYLKNLGLDFGWGPTSCCQWLLEHVYIMTGMPWWATLAVLPLAWRIVMFLPTLNGSKHSALLQKVYASPDYRQARLEFEEATIRTHDRMTMMRARNRMSIIRKNAGASVIAPFINFLTIPFSYGVFRSFRAMAAIPVPSLETGGFAWFTDLTVHDPYFILPLASVAMSALMFRQTQAANLTPKTAVSDKVSTYMMYGLPPIMFLCTGWLPAGLQWFFFMFSISTVVQTSATLNPAVRRWADLPPLGAGLQHPLRPSQLGGAGGAVWQAPSAPAQPAKSEDAEAAKTIGGTLSSLVGDSKSKQEWRKAQEYEDRRAAEDKAKASQRLEDLRRRRLEKGRR